MRHDLYPPGSDPPRLLLRSVLCRALVVFGVFGALGAILLLSVGCRMLPQQRGGATGVAIDRSGVAVSTRLADSPRESSEQTVTRISRETFAAPPTPSPSPAGSIAPAGITILHDTVPALSRETQETVHTRIGASQDLAGIVKAAQSGWRRLFELLVGAGLIAGAWAAYRNGWPTPALALAIGGVTCILWGVWWAIGAGVLAGVAVLAYNAHPYKLP